LAVNSGADAHHAARIDSGRCPKIPAEGSGTLEPSYGVTLAQRGILAVFGSLD